MSPRYCHCRFKMSRCRTCLPYLCSSATKSDMLMLVKVVERLADSYERGLLLKCLNQSAKAVCASRNA